MKKRRSLLMAVVLALAAVCCFTGAAQGEIVSRTVYGTVDQVLDSGVDLAGQGIDIQPGDNFKAVVVYDTLAEVVSCSPVWLATQCHYPLISVYFTISNTFTSSLTTTWPDSSPWAVLYGEVMDAEAGSFFDDYVTFAAGVYDEPFVLYPEQFPLSDSEGFPLDHATMSILLNSGVKTWLDEQALPATLYPAPNTFLYASIRFTANFGPKPCPPNDPFCIPQYSSVSIRAAIDRIVHGVADYAIFADEKIIIRNDAYVVGDVGTNGEQIQISDNGVIDGNQDFGTGIELTAVELPTGGTPIDLVISDSEEVILTEEDSPYRLDRIFIDKLAKAIIEGDVTVYVEGKTEVRGSGQIVVMTEPASSLTIYSGGDVEFRNSAVINQDSGKLSIYGTQDCAKVIVRNDAIVNGVINAPNAFLDIRDRVIIHGSVSGKKTEVRGTTELYWDGSIGGN
jgi:hypothetical protein